MTENKFKQITHRCFTREYGGIPFQARSVGHYKIDASDADPVVRRDFIELYWGIEGEGKFIINGRQRILHPGEICFYLNGDLHQVKASTDIFHYRWMTMDGPMAMKLWQSLQLTQAPKLAGPCPEELFVQLENELMDYSANGLKLASATAFRILMLASSSSSRPCRNYDYVERAKQIIDSQFRNPELNIGMLADKLQVNRSQLCRKFHAAYGVSPVRYLINCRVQFGLSLIENSNDKIMEIAVKSGFDNPNYFSKSIKKYTGIPLRKFR